MSHRFLVYPLLFIVLLQLGPLRRGEARWYAVQILQSLIILLLLAAALLLSRGLAWVLAAWVVFGLLVGLPRLLLAGADHQQQRARWRSAALGHQLAGWLLCGRLGRLHRDYATTLRRLAAGQPAAAERLLDVLAVPPLPSPARGMVLVWKLTLLTQQQAWERALDFYESTAEWGTLWALTQARLLAANAYVETGQAGRAVQCLEFVVLSPLGVRLATPLRLARARLAARAGAAPQSDDYQHGVVALRWAEEQAAPWRALMQAGRPGAVTLSLLAVLAAVFVTELVLPAARDQRLVFWAANSTATFRLGQWWRPVTAMFLHANLLHLVMNGLGLWIFGAAVEKAIGRGRLLLIFLLGGVVGNLVSAAVERHEIAVGASGGVFALVAAFAVAAYQLKVPRYAAVRRRLLLLLAAMVAADLTIGWLEPQVDNLAHLGGFGAGLMIAALLRPRRRSPASGPSKDSAA